MVTTVYGSITVLQDGTLSYMSECESHEARWEAQTPCHNDRRHHSHPPRANPATTQLPTRPYQFRHVTITSRADRRVASTQARPHPPIPPPGSTDPTLTPPNLLQLSSESSRVDAAAQSCRQKRRKPHRGWSRHRSLPKQLPSRSSPLRLRTISQLSMSRMTRQPAPAP